jgi:hypothetical protein
MSQMEVPLTFIYGEHDWMDPEAGERICKNLATANNNFGGIGVQQIAASKNNYRVLFIPDAGHFPFLEKPEHFNEVLLETLEYCLEDRHVKHPATAQYHGEPVDQTDAGVSPSAIEAACFDV